MAAPSHTPRASPWGASPTPGPPATAASSSANGVARTGNGVCGAVAGPAAGSGGYDSASTSRSSSPRIPRTIVANGATFDVFRPEELEHEVPVFGERRRRAGTARLKKAAKWSVEEEDEAEWEAKRRRLIREKVLKKEFAGYTEEDMALTEDGLWLPEMPEWLNVTRERQDDGSLGVFMARPSKEDIETRWPEIVQAMEPIGVAIGAVKIILPSEYLDVPRSAGQFSQRICRSTSPFPPAAGLPPARSNTPTPTPLPAPAPAPAPVPVNGSRVADSRSPRPDEHGDLIPPPQFDKNGIPKIWIVDQRLPLHTKSVSSLAPIYCVSSTNKRQVSGSQLLADISEYEARQRRIAAGDPAGEAYSSLTESTMLMRGRTWPRISAGDKGGISIYSSDNDADPYTRAWVGVGNPHLTDLPGNAMFDSKSKIVGIHTPFFYFGRAHTLFALHAEDYNAMSLNYHHFGADKIWRVVSPHCYHVVEDFIAAHLYPRHRRKRDDRKCSQFVRHASIYLPGPTLDVAGARSIQFRQRPGELVVTWPLAYHEGYNEGLNINEACGYGHKNWRRVFATGEEERGEEAIYRPCGERCMGGVNPIILDFEPEGGMARGIQGGSSTPAEAEAAAPKVAGGGGGKGRGRKRSRPVEEAEEEEEEEEDGGRGRRCRSPQKKVKLAKGEQSAMENKPAAEDDDGGNWQRARAAEEVAWDQSTPESGGTAENRTDNSKVESEGLDDIEVDDYRTENTGISEAEETAEPFGRKNGSEVAAAGKHVYDDEQRAADEAGKMEDDESEVEGVNLVPVQPDVE